jgi:RNA polymerase sigma-70 factor, ECF subfamily
LPNKQRVAVELVKLQEYSIDEATQRMGMSASAVKVSLHRAVKALRKKLEDV